MWWVTYYFHMYERDRWLLFEDIIWKFLISPTAIMSQLYHSIIFSQITYDYHQMFQLERENVKNNIYEILICKIQ